MSPAVRVGAGPDGALTYLIAMPPEALPAVRRRDIESAWHAARGAAAASRWGTARAFRFRRADGGVTDLALTDDDARCWAGAVDGTVGMESSYGVSVCLRLLALVDLMSRAVWTRDLYAVGHDGTEFHPALLDAAANEPLDRDARFDEQRIRARLGARRALAPPPGGRAGRPRR